MVGIEVIHKQLSVANTPPASPKMVDSPKANEPEILPFEQLMKKEVIHKEEPIEMANEIEGNRFDALIHVKI